jgi:hypothetical protein
MSSTAVETETPARVVVEKAAPRASGMEKLEDASNVMFKDVLAYTNAELEGLCT